MRKFVIGLAATAILAVVAVAAPRVGSAFSESEYTGNGKPQFNVYTGVPVVGDEHDFLKVGAKDAPGTDLKNSYEACEGEATVSVYVHNGAPEVHNGTNNDGTGVAKNTRLKVNIPATSAGEFSAAVSADNAVPQSTTDTAKITCQGKEVQFEYVPGSVQLFSLDRGNVVLGAEGDAVKTNGGLLLGSLKGDGIVPGCWNGRNYVKMVVKIKKVVKPQASYKCELFEAIQHADKQNKYTFRAKSSVSGGAVVKSYDFDFGNGQKQTVTTDKNEATSQEVVFDKDAKARVTVNFTVDGQTKSDSDDKKCVVQIKFNQPPVNPTPPAVQNVEKIADTGPASTFGLFTAVSALAYGVKRYVDSRRGLSQV